MKELEREINLLKRELSYYQNAMYEIGQKRAKKEQSAPCQGGFGIAKCQVSFTFYIFFSMVFKLEYIAV